MKIIFALLKEQIRNTMFRLKDQYNEESEKKKILEHLEVNIKNLQEIIYLIDEIINGGLRLF